MRYGLDYRNIDSAIQEGPKVEKPSFLPTVQQTVGENCSIWHDRVCEANVPLAGITDLLAEDSLSIALPCCGTAGSEDETARPSVSFSIVFQQSN